MSIDFQTKHSILIVTVTGRWSRPEGELVQSEAAKQVREKGLTGVLIDIREAEIDVSTLDIFDVTKAHATLFPTNIKHAMVYRPDENTLQDANFFENVASNRSVQARAFTDLETAMDWLESPQMEEE